jgi:DNA repair exonuclease SbcCD ATPase subunit
MKKQHKNKWLKPSLAIIFVFGLGAAVLVFSSESDKIKKEVKIENSKALAVTETTEQKNILDSLSTLKEAYDQAILEKTALSKELELERKNVENLMEIIKASQNPSADQIRIYRDQLLGLKSSLESKVVEIKKLKSQNKNLLTEIESQNVVMYNQKIENDTLVSKQKKLESTLKDASKLYLSNFKAIALREKSSGAELETTKAKNTKKLKISFTVNGNAVAKTGRRVFYVQVLDQKNTVLGENKLIEFGNDKALVYSFIVSSDFQGKSVNAYGILNGDQFKKGTYFVNYFDKQEIMGSTSITLE